MINKIAMLTLMYDFYGQLLTDKQQQFMELYYGHDYSLGEIAQDFNVSRQAVHDTLKRTENMLKNYEDKLQLVDRFLTQRQKLSEVAMLLDQCVADAPDQIVKARQILQEVLEMDRG